MRSLFLLVVASLFIWLAAQSSATTISFSDAEITQLKAFSSWPQRIPADAGNELSGKRWAEALGEKLFNDPGLSGNQTISCSSCHQADKAFTDGLATAQGEAQHVRNTQGLLNVGYQHWFGWDGGADSLWAASLRPILSDIEMNASIESAAAHLRSAEYVQRAMQNENIDTSKLEDEALLVLAAKAMGAFQRTLISGETSFDKFVKALLADDATAQSMYPTDARQGLKLFFGDGNCHVCHFGPNFSNGEFHDIGRPFFTAVGQIDPGRHSGVQRVRTDPYNLMGRYNGARSDAQIQKTQTVKLGQVNFGQWRTPGLRNLIHTAPYMHDGTLTTLREVVDSYADIDPTRLHTQGESLLKPRDWSNQEREALVAFLKTLSQ